MSEGLSFDQDVLLREMREICHAVLRAPWVDGIEYQLWAVLVGFERHSRGKATGTEFMRCLAAPPDGFGACKKSAGNWHVSNNGRECRPSQPANPMTDSAASSSSQPVVFRSSLPSQADKGECFAWNRSDIPKPSFRPSSARPTTDPRSGKRHGDSEE